MSEKKKPISRGRGAQRTPQPGPSQQLPHARPSTSEQVARRPGQAAQGPPAAATGGRGAGKQIGAKGDSGVTQLGKALDKLALSSGGASGGGDAAIFISSARGAARGKHIIPQDIFITKPSHISDKKGVSGSKVVLKANYFKFVTTPDWCIFQYRVDFTPEEDRTVYRKALLRVHKDKIGAYMFDGTVLYSNNRLPENMELISTRQSDNTHIKISIRVVGSLAQGDPHYIQFFNIIMRRCLDHLQLQLVGRNYFDANSRVSLPDFKLELWPGYVTSIRQHEHSILMCAEITHKVMRQETLLDILRNCARTNEARRNDIFKSTVIGTVVLTDYNNNTYRIEDVDFSTTPLSTFPKKDGTRVSYMEYYKKRYGITIRERNQPMLLTKNKPKSRQADQDGEDVFLVPELCRATGLTDKMRDNFSLMKSLATHTRVDPNIRIAKLMKFSERLHKEPNVMKILSEWNMSLENNLVEFNARVLGSERIIFGRNIACTPEKGDWSREMQNKKCLVAKDLTHWVLIAMEHDSRSVQNFVDTLLRVSNGISFLVNQPQIFYTRDDRASSYSEFLENILSKHAPQLVFCVVSNNRIDRYSAIKKKCCVDRPVPSQVYLQKNLTHKNLMSIATKVAIQMNCKLGGAPWFVEIPLDGLMVIGFDVCHDTLDSRKDVGAMVASMDRYFTQYFSTADLHSTGDELSNELSSNVCKAALAYRQRNNILPSHIAIYRDGVGEGQISQVVEREVADIRKKLTELYGGENYKMSFIIVTKRLNTRLFCNRGNPPTGTVVDDVLTNPIKYDFFIVSQQVKTGTVSPTSYNVVYDNIGIDPDKIQRLTYKLTHMYFNCTQTVRVPAPCHYAHKLAFMVSKYIHQMPKSQLQNTLYFL